MTATTREQHAIRPARLAAGARVALVAPSGPVTDDRIRSAQQRCRSLGLTPVLAPAARARLGYFAGPDAERARDLQRALDSDEIDAVWALRGGYGSTRILPRLDLSPLQQRPKAVIGFSDSTALHLALARAGVVSFHAPHAGTAAFPRAVDDFFRRVLFRAEPAGRVPAPGDATPAAPRDLVAGARLRAGVAEGRLIGGNLSLLAALCGTPWALDARGRILLIEDVGEPAYRIDRMLTQLAQSGAVDGVVGIAFGRFTRVPECANDRPVRDVLAEWVEALGVPAAAGLPFGHVDENQTLPLGVRARLDADAATLEVLEPAVGDHGE